MIRQAIIFLSSLIVISACASTSVSKSTSVNNIADGGIDQKVKGMTPYEGYFNYYYDQKQDKIWLVVDKINTEFLYVNSLTAGIGSNDIGIDRNRLGGSRVVKFIKAGPKLLLKQPNYDYRAVSNNADEVKAVEEAFATSILHSFKVEAEQNGKYLIDMSDFLIHDEFNVSGRLKGMNQGSYSLNKSKSYLFMDRTKNFPQNSEFEAELTFDGTPTGGYIRSVTPTPSSVTVRQHHSFVQLPDDKYIPRKFDPRAGYFGTSYYDYATPVSEPLEKKFITRHRLEKKDPNAAKSEAVEPIVYYLDRGTPEPIRSALLEGASWWNQAFEAAGFINAFQVKMLPAEADPMDVRYNVINWVHRSTRGWSYGSSVTDPRTGEIIKGHVTLGSLRVRQDYLIAEGLLAPYENGETVPPEMLELALARLRQLSAHEVGHTIGLAHSYASSAEGRASVMDYPHPLATLKDGKISFENAYDNKIGAWDKVSIAWGYAQFSENTSEDKELEAIIQEGLKKGLTFLTDQDARPAGSAHPYAHLWDNGENVATELDRMLAIRKLAISNFGEKNIRKDVPYSYLEEVLAPLYFSHRYQVEATTKLIGGLNYRNAIRGDGQLITEMVPANIQKQALESILKTLDPEVLTLPENVISKIPPRANSYRKNRETFNSRTGITFDPVSAAEASSYMTLSFLFHPNRAARMIEYSKRNSALPSLVDVVDQTINSTIKSQRKSGLQNEVQHIVEQMVIQNLIELGSNQDQASSQTIAIVRLKLSELKSWLDRKASSERNIQEKAHQQYMAFQIEQFLANPTDFKYERPMDLPDGSPIGMGMECEW